MRNCKMWGRVMCRKHFIQAKVAGKERPWHMSPGSHLQMPTSKRRRLGTPDTGTACLPLRTWGPGVGGWATLHFPPRLHRASTRSRSLGPLGLSQACTCCTGSMHGHKRPLLASAATTAILMVMCKASSGDLCPGPTDNELLCYHVPPAQLSRLSTQRCGVGIPFGSSGARGSAK